MLSHQSSDKDEMRKDEEDDYHEIDGAKFPEINGLDLSGLDLHEDGDTPVAQPLRRFGACSTVESNDDAEVAICQTLSHRRGSLSADSLESCWSGEKSEGLHSILRSLHSQATFRSDDRKCHSIADKEADREASRALYSRRRLKFLDPTREFDFVAHTNELNKKHITATYLMAILSWTISWTRTLVEVEWNYALPDACYLGGIFTQLLLCQFVLILRLFRRKIVRYIPIDLCIILFASVAGITCIWILLPNKMAQWIGDSPDYFDEVDGTDAQVLIVLLLFISIPHQFFVIRSRRSWIIPFIVVPCYAAFTLPLLTMEEIGVAWRSICLLAFGSFCAWFSSLKSELKMRIAWHRTILLLEEVEDLKNADSQVEDVLEEVKKELTQALACGDDESITQLKGHLLAFGIMDEQSIDDFIKATRKQQSEEAGVSVAYILSDEFEDIVRKASPKEDPTFHEICEGMMHNLHIGENTPCPRDGQLGCAFSDTLPLQHRQQATHFISWLWGYKFSTIRSALGRWVHSGKLDPSKTFVFMCFFLNNQYRILVGGGGASKKLDAIFESNIARIRKVVAILDTWNNPPYLTRIWTIFEQLIAMELGIDVTVVMPPEAASSLIKEFERGRVGILRVKSALTGVHSEHAKATFAEDEEHIKELIRERAGFHKVNKKIAGFMIRWIVMELETYMRRLMHSKQHSHHHQPQPIQEGKMATGWSQSEKDGDGFETKFCVQTSGGSMNSGSSASASSINGSVASAKSAASSTGDAVLYERDRDPQQSPSCRSTSAAVARHRLDGHVKSL